MKIRAAVLEGPGKPFEIQTLDLGEPRTGEVLIRVLAAGVCHSDWHLVTGATAHPFPVVAGHEGSGIVEKLGPGVSGLQLGDLVALNWAPACGECYYCLHDRPSLCSIYLEPIWAGAMMDGTTRLSCKGKPVYHFSALACFADFAVVPEQSCVKLPNDFPADVAALIGCAVTTGVGSVLNTAHVKRESSVVIFGAGGVGLSTLLGALYAGAAITIVVDRTPEKLAIAKQLGAHFAIFNDDETVPTIRNLTGGRGADYAFEAIGFPSVQEQCLNAIRPGGAVVLSGIAPAGSATNLPGAVLTRQEKSVLGCYYGTCNPARDFPLYADLYLRGDLPLDRLITRRYSLEQINDAYQDMLAAVTARGVIEF